MSSQITAKKLVTAVVLGLGIWYVIPSLHAKFNIESHFGYSLSAQTVSHIGIALIVAGIVLNSQVGYELYPIKQLNFLSPTKRRETFAISNFCNLVNNMEEATNAGGMPPMDGPVDF